MSGKCGSGVTILSNGLGVARESAPELSSAAWLMVDVCNLLFFVVKIVGR